jgi:tetratricopeptide (TPR) repeat protein
MPELHLHRHESTLEVILDEHRSRFPLADVVLNATTWERIYEDAAVYGRQLFDKTFRDEQLRAMLANLPANERLLLVAEDPLVASIPWEYLRDQNNKLLASRLNVVRGLPEAQRRESFTFTGPLEIIAIPVSPVDEPRMLNVEREWKNLVEAVTITSPPKSLTLKRTRPPTRSQLERSLSLQGTTIVHFMGHSTSDTGKAYLTFEDARARSHLVEAADFADSLNSRVFLVVLNSCLSAVVVLTEFGNIAWALVQRGVPYALGMQFILPDDAALVLSDALYDFLLQGHSVEEAVMHTRRALEEPRKLPNSQWLAGIPVLYTSLRTPAPTIELAPGQPTIRPEPELLQQTCDLTALTQPEHFLGRGDQISKVLDILLSPHQRGFVLLHGLGGIGKTSLARAIADRVIWHYGDRVLAFSFEAFAYLDANNQRVIDGLFADRFFNRLARFYGLDLTDSKQYPTTTALQQAILQRRAHMRSLLVLDNIETLIDAQRQGQPAAQALATFISRLKEGEGAILLTSRMIPPSDWGECQLIEILGLQDEVGADLFLALLHADHKHLAPPAARLALSHRVQGHPLSIQLLAGRFTDETSIDLFKFLANIEAELGQAEQTTPFSLEDPDRQRTLYACMDYSMKRLTSEQRKMLNTVSIFRAPFPPEYASYLLNEEEQNLIHIQNLVRLGLLTSFLYTFKEGSLILVELHTMLRWYIQQHRAEQEYSLQERYGEVYEELIQQACQREGGYDQSTLMNYLVRQSLPDCEIALQYLPPAARNTMAYRLAYPYVRLGQYQRALALYEQALEGFQELGDNQGVGVTQHAMADVLVQQDKLQDALELYEQALRTKQELGDNQGVGVTQHAMADVLRKQGRFQESLELYEQSLSTGEKLNAHEVAVTQQTIANVLMQQGKLQDALEIFEQVLSTVQELGDLLGMAGTQYAIANVLVLQEKFQEALELYNQVLHTMLELGNSYWIMMTQQAIAGVFVQQGKLQEALELYEQALHTARELNNHQVVVLQRAIAGVFVQQGKLQEALELYEQTLHTARELGDGRGATGTQHDIADVLIQQGRLQEALELYEQALHTVRELGDGRAVAMMQQDIADVLVQQGKLQEALELYEQSLHITSELGDLLGVTAILYAITDVLVRQDKLQDALMYYEQCLNIWQELGDIRRIALIKAKFCQLLFRQGNHRRALSMAWESYTSLSRHGFSNDAQTMRQLLIAVKSQVLGSAKFDILWKQVVNEPQPDWLLAVQTGSITISTQTIQAVYAFVNAESWEATRQVIETQQSLLFQPEVETIFEENIIQAKTTENQRAVQVLEQHLSILRECKKNGIASTFEKLATLHHDEPPFDAELIPRSITALLSSPQEKMAHAQYLAELNARATDEGLKSFLQTIQLALFGGDLSQLGQDLSGVYRQAWATILAFVETEGVDPRLLEQLIHNTLMVLGPADERRNEWRDQLMHIMAQAREGNAHELVALLDAIIRLLDAAGDPSRLGTGLTGIYARTWQTIIDRIAL